MRLGCVKSYSAPGFTSLGAEEEDHKQAEHGGSNILYHHQEQDMFNIVTGELLRKVECRPLVAIHGHEFLSRIH